MTLAHIAGVPFEEWAVPLAATGTGIVYALRAALARLQHGTGWVTQRAPDTAE
jgi:hypothetical protein